MWGESWRCALFLGSHWHSSFSNLYDISNLSLRKERATDQAFTVTFLYSVYSCDDQRNRRLRISFMLGWRAWIFRANGIACGHYLLVHRSYTLFLYLYGQVRGCRNYVRLCAAPCVPVTPSDSPKMMISLSLCFVSINSSFLTIWKPGASRSYLMAAEKRGAVTFLWRSGYFAALVLIFERGCTNPFVP